MIGLLADVGNVHFPDLRSAGGGNVVALAGPVGLGDFNGSGNSVGLAGGVGLEFSGGSGGGVGLH